MLFLFRKEVLACLSVLLFLPRNLSTLLTQEFMRGSEEKESLFFCWVFLVSAECLQLSGTESAIQNRESGDSESCDSNRAIPRSL